MYGNAYVPENEKAQSKAAMEAEDPVKLQEFEDKVQRGEKIEPQDWMPAEYKKQVLRMIEQHAHSEIVGALPEGTWITRAPSFKRKMALIAKVQDEVGHGQLLYGAAETLGKTREQMINDLLNGKSKYSNVFNYPAKTWADVTVIGFLVDAAAIVNQVNNAKGSYGPYVRALDRINYEESFHLKQGHDAFVALATGTSQQRQMVQEALYRWWQPIMHFFGPSDKDSQHTEKLMRWKVKMASNDDMRQQFLSMYVPKLQDLDLDIPDPNLYKDPETKEYHITEPDWDEFYQVIKGNGPCNAERLAVRRWAEENGQWVKDALKRYAKGEEYVIPYA